MPHEKIIALIDQFSEEKDYEKKTAILKELQKLLAEERSRLKAESKATSA